MSSATLIDSICADFEAAWNPNQPPNLRRHLKKVEASDRSVLAKKLIALDVQHRLKNSLPTTGDLYASFGPGGVKLATKRIKQFQQSAAKVAVGNSAQRPSPISSPATDETFVLKSLDTVADDQTEAEQHRSLRTGPRVSSDKLGRFEIVSELGAGSFGKVMKAWDPHLERHVALKIPTFDPSQEKQVARFVGEAKSAGRLKHQNIVTTLESGKIKDQYYIASELVEGTQLSDRLTGRKMLLTKAVTIVHQLADALDYAHGEGIVHRDIKPDNIMIDEDGQPFIMDFGLAKRSDDDQHMTTEGALLGTPAYMSPEQARGQTKQVGPASDQYSLAVVLYHMLCGQPPFDGPAHTVVLEVAKGEIPPPRLKNHEIDRRLESILLKALATNPDDRFASCGEFRDELIAWQRGEKPNTGSAAKGNKLLEQWRRNGSAIGLSIVAAGLLGFVSYAGWYVYFSPEATSEIVSSTPAVGQASDTDKKADRVLAGTANVEKQLPSSPGEYVIAYAITKIRQEQRQGIRTIDNGTGPEDVPYTFTVDVPFQEQLMAGSNFLPQFELVIIEGKVKLEMTLFEGRVPSTRIVESASVSLQSIEGTRGPDLPANSVVVAAKELIQRTYTYTVQRPRRVSEQVPAPSGGTETVTKTVMDSMQVEGMRFDEGDQVVKTAVLPFEFEVKPQVDGIHYQLGAWNDAPHFRSIDQIATTLPLGVSSTTGPPLN